MSIAQRKENFISKHIVAIVGICAVMGVSVFSIIIAHDVYIQDKKMDDTQKRLLMEETCSDLKGDVSFFNSLNEGQWIKPYDTSKFEQRMQELNCK